MKKITLLVLSLLLTVSLFACQDQSDDTPETTAPETENEIPEATPASDFEYEVNDDGDIVITKYIGNEAEVVIPQKIENKTVTAIGESAFKQSKVEIIYMPNTINNIYRYAFEECQNLKKVKFSENLRTIAIAAFSGCVNLTSADLSADSMFAIDSRAFYNCSSLKELKLGKNIKELRDFSFQYCSSLENIELPYNLEKLGEAAFADCTSLKTVTIPPNVVHFSCTRYASFSNNPILEKIVFQEGREEIKGYACFQTTSNVEIVIPKGVKVVSPYTFFIYGPTKITFLGDCPELIDTDSFTGNPTIYYDPSTKGWDNCSWKNHHTLEPIK